MRVLFRHKGYQKSPPLTFLRLKKYTFPVLWIRIGFSQGAKPMRIQNRIRIRILVRLKSHKKLHFYMKNILTVGNKSKNVHTKVQKPFLKSRKPCLFDNLVNFDAPGGGAGPAYLIRIRIHDSQMNADPCGSGSTSGSTTLLFSNFYQSVMS